MEESSGKQKFLDVVRQKIRILFGKALSKEVRIFCVFLLVSSFFWVLQSLQEVREVDLDIPVAYTEVPPEISITGELPKTLSVTLRDKGTNLYYSYRHRKDLKVTIPLMDYYHKEDVSRIPTSAFEAELRDKLISTTQLLRIRPDDIVVYFAQKSVKNVPVRLNSNFTLEPQHMLSDTPHILPATVSVYAPTSVLEKIYYVDTELLSLNGLKDSLQKSVRLKPIEGASLSSKEVTVSVNVEEFTEMSLSIPVEGMNFPKENHLLSFPPEVKVTFFVGLSRFKSIKPSDFKLVVDYGQLIQSDRNNQRVQLLRKPPFVQNVRLFPEAVECLIEQ